MRFNPLGFIDAYNGTGYSALTSIPYTGGTMYSFWFQLNIPAQTYNVFVAPAGGSMVQIGSNYAFQLNAPTLNNVTQRSGQTTSISLSGVIRRQERLSREGNSGSRSDAAAAVAFRT